MEVEESEPTEVKDSENMEVEQDEPTEVKNTKDMEVEQEEPTEVKDTENKEDKKDEVTEVKNAEEKEKKELEEELEKRMNKGVTNETPEASASDPPRKRARTKADALAIKAGSDDLKNSKKSEPTGTTQKQRTPKAKSSPKKSAKRGKKAEKDDEPETEKKEENQEKEEKPDENETPPPNDAAVEPEGDTKPVKKKRTRAPPGEGTFAKRYLPGTEYGAAKFTAIRDAFNETIKPELTNSWKHQELGLS